MHLGNKWSMIHLLTLGGTLINLDLIIYGESIHKGIYLMTRYNIQHSVSKRKWKIIISSDIIYFTKTLANP